MAKSKTDKKRKNKVKEYKKKMSKKEEVKNVEMPTAEQQGLPEVREVPTWPPTAELTIMGREFELLYNGVNELGNLMNQGMSTLYSVAQSVMQSNIANGNVTVNFEKLTEQDNQPVYVPMTDEEAAEPRKQLEEFIQKINETKERIKAEAEAIRQETAAKDAGLVLPTDEEVEKLAKKN